MLQTRILIKKDDKVKVVAGKDKGNGDERVPGPVRPRPVRDGGLRLRGLGAGA